ncbi:MAG: PLDc N-terminal domain-containing protein [Candidatus Thorarchaeota archaeon]
MDTGVLLAIVLPAVFIDTAFKVYSTINLVNTWEKRENLNRIIWLIIIWVINTIGWVMYLLFGRIPKETTKDAETWD